MSDEGAPRQLTAAPIDRLGKWIALLGALIAVGQGATTWISGYWNSEAEQRRAEEALRLADLKERSALAAEYLRLIIAKDTALAERVTLLDALGSIENHPLQQWARERHKLYRDALARSDAAFQAQQDAALAKEGAERDEAALRAEIERLNSDLELEPDNRELRERLQPVILAKLGELAKVRGRLSVAVVRYETTQTTIRQVQQPVPLPVMTPSPVPTPAPAPPPNASSVQQTTTIYGLADTITEISQRVTVERLVKYFPATARANVELAAPFLQAALQEFRIADKQMVAAIIATIVVETPRFEAYEEPAEAAAKYEGRLGNNQAGDGVRYRGRGYLGITGRANYTAMSTRLGLGTRLVDSPEDASRPEVATRVLVAWFVDRQSRLLPALSQDDLATARRIIVGSATRDVDQFVTIYRRVLAEL